jgi:uncharacterized protein (DUF2141 family)
MMKRFQISLLLLPLLGSFALITSANGEYRGNFNIEIDALRNNKGQVCANIYKSSKGFPQDKTKVFQSKCVKIGETLTVVSFENLPAGNYAVAVIHDENGDREMNSDDLGIPLEGFGFSRNPQVTTKAPTFAETALFVVGASTDTKIALKYF